MKMFIKELRVVSVRHIFNIEDEIRCAITQDFRRIIESGSASLGIFSELFADRIFTADDNSIRMFFTELLHL